MRNYSLLDSLVRRILKSVFWRGGTALLLLASFASATNLTGTIKYANGRLVNGTIVFALAVPGQDTSNFTVITSFPITYNLVNGVITSAVGTPILIGNDSIQPANTFYVATVRDSFGRLVMSAPYRIVGGTFDIGQAVPTTLTTSNIAYLNPVGLGNPNTWTNVNTFQQPVTFSNTTTFSNAMTYNGAASASVSPLKFNIGASNQPSNLSAAIWLDAVLAGAGNPSQGITWTNGAGNHGLTFMDSLGNMRIDLSSATTGVYFNKAFFSPSSPLLNYYVVSDVVTPAATNANTCAEQTFTPAAFSGMATVDHIFITPSATMAANGVFPVEGIRPATNGIKITYCNVTGGALTAPSVTLTVTGMR